MNPVKFKAPKGNPRYNCPGQNTISGEVQAYDFVPLNPLGWGTYKDIRAMKN